MQSYEQYRKVFEAHGLEIDAELYQKLHIYSEFLCEYNKKCNLTSITDPQQILIKHFLDSIYPLTLVNIPENARLIDIGTGAGFPAVPIKLYRPDLTITLLDSLNKRVKFLNELCGKLNISAECLHSRAEISAKASEYREKYDVVTARAVAPMEVLCEYCIPYTKIDGIFIAMKGPNEDIFSADNKIKYLGGEIIDDIKYNLDNSFDRRLIIIKKISQTPSKYPRNSSQIMKK